MINFELGDTEILNVYLNIVIIELFQGRTLSVELNELGTLMWVGNDRGYIEVTLIIAIQ